MNTPAVEQLPLMELPEPPRWRGIAGNPITGRISVWAHAGYPGVVIHHCGHQTALRPYYIQGLPIERKFSRLKLAQRAVELYSENPDTWEQRWLAEYR